jgi:two-component system, chemotaxis family, sensor kinase CheA
VRRLARYLILPKELSAFEAGYLHHLNRVGLIFFALHIPVMVVIAWLNGTGPWLALALSAGVVAGPAMAYVSLPNPRTVSLTYGVAAMFMGGVLVHVGQGPMQIEMHFYFFALLAMLAVFGNPMVIVVAAVTVALHHLALWFLIPRSIFNYDAPVWVVAVHSAFVVLEAVAGCYIARSFFDNVIGLEKIVQARVAELDARNRDMRLVLDHVGEGLLTLDRRAVPAAERSRVFDHLFPPSEKADDTIFDLFERGSPEFAERSRVGWEEVTSAIMPLALTLDQMPAALVVENREHTVSYMAIGEGDSPERFLVVVTDVSAEASRARADRDRLETMELFERLLADRSAVETFFEEGSALADAIGSDKAKSLPTLQRMLHTLKGNSAVFGLLSLSALCHDLETWVAEEKKVPPPEVLAPFREHWGSLVARVKRLPGTTRETLQVEKADYETLEQSVRKGGGDEALLTMVTGLKLEPTQRRLEHFAEQARRIAGRLDKEVQVQIDGHGLRVDPKHWGGFWSAFIHSVRNAVDHGLDSTADRVAQGKPALGTIGLRTYVRGDRFVVEISDDGRGIDWAQVARKALELGLPAATESDLRGALFRDGVSTASHVTDISGRGLGMGAVRAATEALGGHLEIETELRHGTTLRMVFPKAAMTQELETNAHASSTAAA